MDGECRSNVHWIQIGTDFCSLTWSQAQTQYPNTTINLLKTYCFTTNYFYNVLYNGYGFAGEGTNITFTQTSNGTDLGWPLGAMIYKVNLISLSSAVEVVVDTMMVVFLALAVTLAV